MTMIAVLDSLIVGFVIGIFATPHIRDFLSGYRLGNLRARRAPMAPYANELLEVLQENRRMVPEDWTVILIVSDGERAGFASNADHGPRTAGALRNMADDIERTGQGTP
jgi:hypothetical protein